MTTPHGPGDDPEVTERFRAYRRSGSTALRNDLVRQHHSVAQAIARRFAGRGEPLDDLEQVATIGLVKAVERFDPEMGIPFVGYASPTITGELRRHFRDRTWVLKVSRRAKDLHVQLPKTVERLRQELGRSPTPSELAVAMDRTVDEVLDALDAAAAYRTVSSDTPSGASAVGTALHRTHGQAGTDAEDQLVLHELLSSLPDRERAIVEMRFFEDLTQPEIAQRLGISQVHVSRLLRRSLDQLQKRSSREDIA